MTDWFVSSKWKKTLSLSGKWDRTRSGKVLIVGIYLRVRLSEQLLSLKFLLMDMLTDRDIIGNIICSVEDLNFMTFYK